MTFEKAYEHMNNINNDIKRTCRDARQARRCAERYAYKHSLKFKKGEPSIIYEDGSERLLQLVRETFFELRLTNAHNEWLTILVNEGLLGFIGFAGMMVSFVVRAFQSWKTNVLGAACGMGVLAYTINNMFSFQQSMSTPTMFVILGLGECLLEQSRRQKNGTE